MTKILLPLLAALLIAAPGARAQDSAAAPPPPPPDGWKHSLVAGLNLTQVSYTNWAKGGENSLAYTFSLDGKSVLTSGPSLWENQYRFAYGEARLGPQGLRKTDDIIDIASVYTYVMSKHLNPYAAVTARSQFSTGYKYDENDFRTPVSAFLDPGYFTQAVGVRYEPMPEVRTRLGAGLREVVTDKYTMFNYADDPKTVEVEKTSVTGGLESVTDVEWKAMENVLFTSQLALFGPFNDMEHPIVNFKNKLAGKVNSYLSAIFEFELIYDNAVSPKRQLREGIALGFSYTLF